MNEDGWPRVPLNRLGFVGRGRSKHRPRNDPALYGGSTPFFQTGDVKAADFWLREHSQTYNQRGLAQSKLWPVGTLCITIAANIAESAVLGVEGAFPDSVVGFIADPALADVRFVKYALDTLRLEMQGVSRGTTQDNLSLDKLLTFGFPAPSLAVQRRIAGILSAYDELIENCVRRIRVLDEMARAVYREWFVNFRHTAHVEGRLVESALGHIPRGWSVQTLTEVALLTMGHSPKSEFYNEQGNGLPFHQGVTNFGARFPEDHVYCTADARTAEAGDILFSVRAPVGRMNFASRKIALGRGLSALRHRNGQQVFLWEQLRAQFSEEDMIGNGAIFAAVTKQDMESIKLIAPPEPLIAEFNRVAEPLHAHIATLDRAATNLRATRDLLLPRLLSGQLSVEKAADAA